MFNSVLVPTDGSPFSERALPIAAEIAKRTGATLHLVNVFDPTRYLPISLSDAHVEVFNPDLVIDLQQADRQRLDAQVSAFRAQGLAAEAHQPDGVTVETLLEQATLTRADFIVMGTHGRSGFARLRIGSVASAILARSPIPVMLVGGPDTDTPRLGNGPLLCPLDSEPFAEAMLPFAMRFATALGLPLALLGVATAQAVPMAPLGIESLADPAAEQEDARDLGAYLVRVAARCPAGTTTHAIAASDVPEAIVAEADRLDAAAIAMASHVRSGLARLLHGNITDAVVHRLSRPVLVYRPPETTASDIAK